MFASLGIGRVYFVHRINKKHPMGNHMYDEKVPIPARSRYKRIHGAEKCIHTWSTTCGSHAPYSFSAFESEDDSSAMIPTIDDRLLAVRAV